MAVTSVSSQYGDWAQEILESLAKQRESQDSEEVAESTVKSLDRNKDSALTRKESGLSQTAFANADADGDGALSVQELADALANERALIAAGLASSDSKDSVTGALIDQIDLVDHMEGVTDKLMTLLDKDGDSGLSLKESGLEEELFNQVDADGDGVISSQELTDALVDERVALMSGASNAGSASLFDSLLKQAGMSVAMQPRQLRKALQAYGANIMVTALAENDSSSSSLFSTSDILNGGQARMLGLLGEYSADEESDSDISMGLAGLLNSSI